MNVQATHREIEKYRKPHLFESLVDLMSRLRTNPVESSEICWGTVVEPSLSAIGNTALHYVDYGSPVDLWEYRDDLWQYDQERLARLLSDAD